MKLDYQENYLTVLLDAAKGVTPSQGKQLRFLLNGGNKTNILLTEPPGHTVYALRDFVEQIPGSLFTVKGEEIANALKDGHEMDITETLKDYVKSLPRENEESIKLLCWAFMHLGKGEVKYDPGEPIGFYWIELRECHFLLFLKRFIQRNSSH